MLAPALVHSSWCAENAGYASNERLEFLGDAVLGVIITDFVYRTHADLAEGDLTEIRKTVVNSVALSELAEELGVGRHMLLGKGEEQSGGRDKPSILADAMEAIIGAVYLSKGFEYTERFVLDTFAERLANAQADSADYKSRLQELAAHRFGVAPRYQMESTGPDHARTFFVTVTIDGEPHGSGVGRSKKRAEQTAARAAYEALTAAPDAASAAAAAGDDTQTTREQGDDVVAEMRETNHG